MNLRTQRLIDRWMGQALCALVSVWAKLFRSNTMTPPTSAQVQHVLVIMLSEMGSMVLAGPMLAQLRSRYPRATVHLLQLKKNQQVSTLLGITDSANMHALDDSSLSALVASLWAVTWRLRALPVDAVIDCELFSRISALMAFASGAPRSAGFTRHTQEGLYRGDFITCPVPYNPYRHISQQFVALVDALEPPASLPRSKWSLLHTLPSECGMAVNLTAAELAAFGARLHGDFEGLAHPTRKLVLLYASGGILPERAWPAAHYIALGQGLLAAGHAVALIGLPEDKPLARDIQAGMAGLGRGEESHRSAHATDTCFDLTGYTRSIRELLMLFHHADLLVTNDGGPGHFASLTPIRTFMFFGPETSRLYGPLSPRATVFDLQLACSPCLSAYNHRQTFCDGDNQCLKQIAPGPVLAMALRELEAVSA
jgi:ADP-heptose:LPS heptosyltransferase